MATSILLPINSLIELPEHQLRVVKLNEDVVTEYCDDMKDGAVFPPVTVVDTGDEKLLVDGRHRKKASLEAGFTDIKAEIIKGTREDALKLALGANATNGLGRSRADKRNVVMKALKQPQFSAWSGRELADLCKVSHTLVNKVINELKSKPTDDGVSGKISTDTKIKLPNHKAKLEKFSKFLGTFNADGAGVPLDAVDSLKQIAAAIEALLKSTGEVPTPLPEDNHQMDLPFNLKILELVDGVIDGTKGSLRGPRLGLGCKRNRQVD